MSSTSVTLYGNFDFGTSLSLAELLERLHQVSESFLGGKTFNAYVKTEGTEPHYGLDKEELIQTFEKFNSKTEVLSAYSSSDGGIAVNLNIRFNKSSANGLGRFMVVAPSEPVGQEIQAILLGEWTEELSQKLKKKQEEATPPAKIEPKPKPVEVPAKAPPEPFPPLPGKHTQSFQFSEELSPEVIVEAVYDLFIDYFSDATFNIHVFTKQNALHIDVKIGELKTYLEQLGPQLRNLIIKLHSNRDHWLELKLAFDLPKVYGKAELSIVSKHAEAITQKLEEVFKPFAFQQKKLASFHEGFTFEFETLKIPTLLKLVEVVSTRFLGNSPVFGSIYPSEGTPYLHIKPNQLRLFTRLYQLPPKKLLLYIGRKSSPQPQMSISFEISPNETPRTIGSLKFASIEEAKRKSIRDMIWSHLELKSIEQEPQLPVLTKAPTNKKKPSGKQKCYLILPPSEESNEVYEALQEVVEAAGYIPQKADTIFRFRVLPEIQSSLKSADLVIADLSNRDAGVFYQVGLAHSWKKSIIFLSHTVSHMPFDFKSYPNLSYETGAEGIIRLREEFTLYLQELQSKAS